MKEIFNLKDFDVIIPLKKLETMYGELEDISDEIGYIMNSLSFFKEDSILNEKTGIYISADYWINEKEGVKIHQDNMLYSVLESFKQYMSFEYPY
jgi:hypothetical protein